MNNQENNFLTILKKTVTVLDKTVDFFARLTYLIDKHPNLFKNKKDELSRGYYNEIDKYKKDIIDLNENIINRIKTDERITDYIQELECKTNLSYDERKILELLKKIRENG